MLSAKYYIFSNSPFWSSGRACFKVANVVWKLKICRPLICQEDIECWVVIYLHRIFLLEQFYVHILKWSQRHPQFHTRCIKSNILLLEFLWKYHPITIWKRCSNWSDFCCYVIIKSSLLYICVCVCGGGGICNMYYVCWRKYKIDTLHWFLKL